MLSREFYRNVTSVLAVVMECGLPQILLSLTGGLTSMHVFDGGQKTQHPQETHTSTNLMLRGPEPPREFEF